MTSRYDTNATDTPEALTYDLSSLAEYDVRLLTEALGDHDTNRIAESGVRDEPAFAHLERFSAEVETLLVGLTPDWIGGFPIVEVSTETPARNRTASDPFTYCNPAGSTFLYHPGIDSITELTLRYPRPGSTSFTIDLHNGPRTTRLRVAMPSDARRAELVYHYDDTRLGADDTHLVTALNRRPDALLPV